MKKFLIGFLGFFLFGVVALQASSLRLKNDTSNIMIAEILAADGTPIGEETIPPNTTDNWSYDESMRGKPKLKKSITPFTVVWKSEKGDFYSSCPNVYPGSLVTPMQCRSRR